MSEEMFSQSNTKISFITKNTKKERLTDEMWLLREQN